MGSRGKVLFDLNEPPKEEEQEDDLTCDFQHVNVRSQLYQTPQPFVKPKEVLQGIGECVMPNSAVSSGNTKGLSGQHGVYVNASSQPNISVLTGPENTNVKVESHKDVEVASSKQDKDVESHKDLEGASSKQKEDVPTKQNYEGEIEGLNEKEDGECSEKEDGEDIRHMKANQLVKNTNENKDNCSTLDSATRDCLEFKNESKPLIEVVDGPRMKFESKDDSKAGMDLNIKAKGVVVAAVKGHNVRSDTKLPCMNKSTTDGKNPQLTGSEITKDEVPRMFVTQTDIFKLGGLDSGNKLKSSKSMKESKYISCLGNKRKVDEQTEAKLGKKRSRQTVFLNLEDVRQAASTKFVTSKRQSTFQCLTPVSKEHSRSVHTTTDESSMKQVLPNNKDQKFLNSSKSEGGYVAETQDNMANASSEDSSLQHMSRLEKIGKRNSLPTSKVEKSVEGFSSQVPRQAFWKAGMEHKHVKTDHLANNKVSEVVVGNDLIDQKLASKRNISTVKKSSPNSSSYQDTSVERLHREVTSEKFWHHPDDSELQCVPGRFDSAEDYVRVFEPLLFEECRAQLYSTWEELCDTGPRDSIAMVRVKCVERRERGWYDATVAPMHEFKPSFKEGDVAVLSTFKPGSGRFRRTGSYGLNGGIDDPDAKCEESGRVAGTVRKYVPIDNRDSEGAIVHFYVGDMQDYGSKSNEEHILLKLQKQNVVWFLAVLGSLATTQREYVALHAFPRLNNQMQKAILDPSPDQFPKYEAQPPAMPECFTPNFVDHLHKTFNGPQLAAIQWAAMHTAAGTAGTANKQRQEPWPFTLVQGPPGTGKTHTVWGMLNVIHLVQYQHYYCSFLKKLAPETYGQSSDNSNNSGGAGIGSIDEVLKSMDRNLLMLPKICPKPRMLVCAPSNAATDELLQRVLDRGFIDGEMKVYKPDVARVGVDSQNRAAQAVSVERRAEYLLSRTREDVMGLLRQLQGRKVYLAQQISSLQRELSNAAAAGREQGTVGVDPEVLAARDHNRDSMLQNLAAVVEEHDKVVVEIQRLAVLENRFRNAGKFNMDEARSSLEVSFANEAEIVFTTVSSSGRKLFQRLSHGFDMVVIDEAAQASEVAVLPPLSLGAARCVLVGDPQQLPATVISQAAGTLQYSRSLFERFQQAGCPTMLLSVQYRMHREIRVFPSRYFYQNRLNDSESVMDRPDEVYYKDPLLRPYIFYDIMHGRESHRGGSVSYQNIHEAQFAVNLYEYLQKHIRPLGIKVSVGIITPYKLQLKCLQREFDKVLGPEEVKTVYINTVDAFQGQERDVIIMSCVRASSHGVGFVADIRRMNVALTRARRALWVMGNAAALKQSADWSALIEDAKQRGCLLDMDSLPKELVSPRPNAFGPYQGRGLPNSRAQRQGISSQR